MDFSIGPYKIGLNIFQVVTVIGVFDLTEVPIAVTLGFLTLIGSYKIAFWSF